MHQLPWEFNRQKAVLLVIDMQNDFVNKGGVMEVPLARQCLPNIKSLIEECREQDIPVIFTKHVLYDTFLVSPLETAYQPVLESKGMREGTEGIQIVSELAPMPDDIIITKHRYDAFYNTQLETIIRNIRGHFWPIP